MNHDQPKSPERISKQDVLEAFRVLIANGATNPDSLDPQDPNVQKAHALEQSWRDQRGTADHRAMYEQTTLMYDAGFTDRNYLEDVREFVERDMDDLDLTQEDDQKLKMEMEQKLKEIDNLLKN
jgi:hypothetical protein